MSEKLRIPADNCSKTMKTKELGAPVLINPISLEISVAPRERGVTFSMSPVDDVHGYPVRLVRKQRFRPVYCERQINGEQIVVGIPEGTQNGKGGFGNVSRPIAVQ